MIVREIVLFAAAFSIPIVVVERAAATFLIADYERRPRRFIPLMIIALEWLFSLTMIVAVTFGE